MKTKAVGKIIRELRKRLYLSQADLAESSGLSCRWISAIESGRRDPKISTLRKLAKGLEIPLVLIIHLSEDEISYDDSQLHADLLFHLDQIIEAKGIETLVHLAKL